MCKLKSRISIGDEEFWEEIRHAVNSLACFAEICVIRACEETHKLDFEPEIVTRNDLEDELFLD